MNARFIDYDQTVFFRNVWLIHRNGHLEMPALLKIGAKYYVLEWVIYKNAEYTYVERQCTELYDEPADEPAKAIAEARRK